MNGPNSFILDSIFYTVLKTSILDGACLDLEKGSVCALLGRHGTGKSTLLKIAAGQLQPQSGTTIIDGQRIHDRALNKRFTKIGYLPQDSMLPDNMWVNRLIKTFPSTGEIVRDPVIQQITTRKISELSAGERRYLEISLLFCLNRPYFLLDEPFTGVEPLIIERLIEKFRTEYRKGRGLLITDYYYEDVLKIASHAYLMHNKRCYELDGDFKSDLKDLGYLP